MSFVQFLSDHPAETWMLLTAIVSIVHQYIEPRFPVVARVIRFATSMGIDLPKFYGLLRAEFPKLPAIPFLLVCLALTGCADAVTTSVRVVDASHDTIRVAHDTIDGAERVELSAAVQSAPDEATAKAKTAAVEARYANVWARYVDVELAWTAARATVASAQAMNPDNGWAAADTTKLLVSLGVLADSWTKLATQIQSDVKGGK